MRARFLAFGAEKRVKFLVKLDKLALVYFPSGRSERAPGSRASSSVDLVDIKEVVSRMRVTPVCAKFFKKFGTDFLLDEDVWLQVEPVINKPITFRDYLRNDTVAASFKSKSG